MNTVNEAAEKCCANCKHFTRTPQESRMFTAGRCMAPMPANVPIWVFKMLGASAVHPHEGKSCQCFMSLTEQPRVGG